MRRNPAAELCSEDNRCQWWTVNAAGHRRLVEVAGFEVTQTVPPFSVPFGVSHPVRLSPPRDARSRAVSAVRRVLTGSDGVPHAALLARPRR